MTESFETTGHVTAGKLVLRNRDGLAAAIACFPDGEVVMRVERFRPGRSSQQNRFWHGVVIPAFAEHCGYELDEMKDVLALKLIPKEIVDLDTGEVRQVPGHTSKLTTTAFNDLIERAQRLGAEMDIYIPDPEAVPA